MEREEPPVNKLQAFRLCSTTISCNSTLLFLVCSPGSTHWFLFSTGKGWEAIGGAYQSLPARLLACECSRAGQQFTLKLWAFTDILEVWLTESSVRSRNCRLTESGRASSESEREGGGETRPAERERERDRLKTWQILQL